MATKIQLINGFYTGNAYLNQTQMDVNAIWIASYLDALPNSPWSMQPICAMLGNAQQESTVNPGLWEDFENISYKGFGLLQWTPSTKYTSWCTKRGLTPAYMDSALQRIMWEMQSGESDQWIPLRMFNNITFEEFARNTEKFTLETLTRCFMRCYERPSTAGEKIEQRTRYAQHYYDVVTAAIEGGELPPVPADPNNPTPPGQYWFNGKSAMYLRNKGRLTYIRRKR